MDLTHSLTSPRFARNGETKRTQKTQSVTPQLHFRSSIKCEKYPTTAAP